jgi:hypothetical protein
MIDEKRTKKLTSRMDHHVTRTEMDDILEKSSYTSSTSLLTIMILASNPNTAVMPIPTTRAPLRARREKHLGANGPVS